MDVVDVLGAVEEALEQKVRHVRTPEGVRHYHLPIGAPIVNRPEGPNIDRRRSSGGRGSAGESRGGPGPSTRSRPGGRVRGQPEPVRGNAFISMEQAGLLGVPHADKLTGPLTPAFKKKYGKVRVDLPEDPADWFDREGVAAFHRDWRRMDGSPGPRSLATEKKIRAVGKVVDAEVLRRLKLAGIEKPLTQQERDKLRRERSKILDAYDDGKWKKDENGVERYDAIARRLFGPNPMVEERSWDEGEELPVRMIEMPGARWAQLDDDQRRQVTAVLHAEYPELRKLQDRDEAILARLVANDDSYAIAYSTALEDVLRQLRPMGGELAVEQYDFGVTQPMPEDAVAGPNSGVIPYNWRFQGPPWNTSQPRPVNIDRGGLRDYNKLTAQEQKQARIALRELEQGTARTEPKQGALAGTYGIRMNNEARLLVYPHVDGTWHIYAVIPHHDYREAQRRMSDRSVGVAAGPAGDGTVTEIRDPLLDPIFGGPEVQARNVMRVASSRYPASWVEASNAGKPFSVGQSDKEGGRGFYRERREEPTDQLMLGNDVMEERVAVHELAHRMERVVPHIRMAEWTFLHRRTSRLETDRRTDSPEAEAAQDEVNAIRRRIWSAQDGLRYAQRSRDLKAIEVYEQQLADAKAEHRRAALKLSRAQSSEQYLAMREWPTLLRDIYPDSTYKEHERARPDRFITPYIGKDYGDGPASSYEVMSMGMEGVWTGSIKMWADDEHRQLVLGLLAAG